MQHTHTWTDIYGSACACFEGRAGGHTWLVAAPPEVAADLPAALAALDGKGNIQLLVHEGVTPLLAATQEHRPRGVLVVAEQELSSGPAVSLPQQAICAEGGLTYSEGGEFPAWQGALADSGAAGENAAASAVASAVIPVMVTSAGAALATLERWLDATPHGR